MKLRRAKSSDSDIDDSRADLDDLATTADTAGAGGAAKGRPTPKRRESQGKRGPVRAPQTRKEAAARQRQLAKEQRTTGSRGGSKVSTTKPRSAAEQRAALKRGDPDALPRRDQGNTRRIARDWVDSRRMLSNYLLWLLPLLVLASVLPALQIVVLVLLIVFIAEWVMTGKRIRALARERHGAADGSNLSIGFYAGSRAYLPRRWRLPGPQVGRGEEF